MSKLNSQKIKNIILDIVIVLLVCFIAFEIFNKNKPIKIFNHYVFYIMSGSMEPELKVGDYIIVKNTDEYDVGDIITYQLNESYITHRVIQINDDEVITKGDANDLEDQPIKKSQILGKISHRNKIITFIFKYSIFIPVLILIGFCINKLIKTFRKEVKNE